MLYAHRHSPDEEWMSERSLKIPSHLKGVLGSCKKGSEEEGSWQEHVFSPL